MRTASQYYANPKNREKARSEFHHLDRIGTPPESSRIQKGPEDKRAPRLDGWVGVHGEFPESRTADKVAPRAVDHNGWYTNSCQDETVCGIVVTVRIPRNRAKAERIPATDGDGFARVRFLEGIREPWGSDVVSRKSSDLHDDECAAARGADREAEIWAEEERDDDAKFQAETQIGEAKAEIKSARVEISEILAERKALQRRTVPDLFRESAPMGEVSALCRALSKQVGSLLEGIKKNRGRIAELQGNYWFSVEGR
jgi:hypothetical protein